MNREKKCRITVYTRDVGFFFVQNICMRKKNAFGHDCFYIEHTYHAATREPFIFFGLSSIFPNFCTLNKLIHSWWLRRADVTSPGTTSTAVFGKLVFCVSQHRVLFDEWDAKMTQNITYEPGSSGGCCSVFLDEAMVSCKNHCFPVFLSQHLFQLASGE